MLVENTNLENISKCARMHLTYTLRARAIAQPPDKRIQFFQLISSIPCENRPCQFKMTQWIFSKQNLLCLHTVPFVHGPVHASGNSFYKLARQNFGRLPSEALA